MAAMFATPPAEQPELDLEEPEVKPASLCSTSRRENVCILLAYSIFAAAGKLIAEQFSDQDFSAVLTISSSVQCLGFLILLLKVRMQKTAAGISSRTLEMYTVVFIFRLSSTLVKNGYIPVDRSGDWAYQAADVMSLLLVMQLLYCCQVTHKATYQYQLDVFDPWSCLIPACVVLAIFVHGDLDASPLFDIAWTISLNVDAFSLVPQLVMFGKLDGALDGLNYHFVACLCVSRWFSFWFWHEGWTELAPEDGGPNTAGWLIYGAHVVMVVTSSHFMFKYMNAQCRSAKKVMEVLDEK